MPPKVDKEAVQKAHRLKSSGMKQREIAERMGLELRTVQNYLSPSWLAERGLSYLCREGVMSEPPEIMCWEVGPVPDVPTKYVNPFGQMPTGVWATPTTEGTHGPILFKGLPLRTLSCNHRVV
jgi:hypothetical protein